MSLPTTRSLLVELLVEELPPKSLKKLGAAFAAAVFEGLQSRGFVTSTSATNSFATPRRLAVHISHVLSVSPDHELVQRLMPATVAIDENNRLTEAARKRCEKLGRTLLADAWPTSEDGPDRLYLEGDGKNRALYFRTLAAGKPLALGLLSAIEDAIDSLPIAKVMTYQLDDGWTSVKFVRPAHGLVALHGAEVVDMHVPGLGLTAGRQTLGHRFEAAVEPIVVQDADHYAQQLEQQGAVMASFAQRHGEVVRQLRHAAEALNLTAIDDEALLDEVTSLVERPNVLTCEFDAEFLDVPAECLVLTMKANQKYFPLLDPQGALTNKFLVVSNIRPEDASAIIEGNQRVVRPRLADAKFFFDQDRKKTLESRLPLLDKVVYHAKLGSQGERVERVRAIATAIGQQLGGAELAQQADRAAQLAKADLVSDMVGEFPELQGVMGGYYAKHDGESDVVAQAVEDHYKPRFAGDALPRNEAGLAVALADKFETLTGLFGVGEKPSGDKDPFALRRHALGILRMLIERDLPLDLSSLAKCALNVHESKEVPEEFALRISQASQAEIQTKAESGQSSLGFGAVSRPLPSGTKEAVLDFIYERLVGYLRDLGYSLPEVDAVVSLRPDRWGDIPKRLAAVRTFAALPESASLAAANKRIGNILKKSDAQPAQRIDEARLVEPAEKALAGALHNVQPLADALFAKGEYTASLRELAALKGSVDAFFDGVMVNADDPALRANRLALLESLHRTMNRVADLSKLAG